MSEHLEKMKDHIEGFIEDGDGGVLEAIATRDAPMLLKIVEELHRWSTQVMFSDLSLLSEEEAGILRGIQMARSDVRGIIEAELTTM